MNQLGECNFYHDNFLDIDGSNLVLVERCHGQESRSSVLILLRLTITIFFRTGTSGSAVFFFLFKVSSQIVLDRFNMSNLSNLQFLVSGWNPREERSQ